MILETGSSCPPAILKAAVPGIWFLAMPPRKNTTFGRVSWLGSFISKNKDNVPYPFSATTTGKRLSSTMFLLGILLRSRVVLKPAACLFGVQWSLITGRFVLERGNHGHGVGPGQSSPCHLRLHDRGSAARFNSNGSKTSDRHDSFSNHGNRLQVGVDGWGLPAGRRA